MALGEILKNARVQRGLTPSDVAESTHLLVQIVEDLEREDFRRVAAPIYGRGFIKLYAGLLELDPEPLIRDFMDLYAGSRVPAVRAMRTEEPDETVPDSAPVTRTVSGPAPLSPQRQAVQPRPAVRPLSAPLTPAEPGEPAFTRPDASMLAPAPEPLPQEEPPESGAGLVVEPEPAEAESDEPDLFRPQSRRRKSYAHVPSDGERQASEEPRAARKLKLPVFKIGGRMEAADEPAAQDEAAHERRRVRIQAFVDGVTRLKEGVESKLPAALPHKQMVALGGLGLAALVFMAVGIHFLFKMTGTNVKETPAAIVKTVPPPPDMYVD